MDGTRCKLPKLARELFTNPATTLIVVAYWHKKESGVKASKAGKTTVTAARDARRVKLTLLVTVVLMLGLFALYRGGTVSMTPGKVEISTPRPGATATVVKADQKATANGQAARALNSLGTINQGTQASPGAAAEPVPTQISQKAKADGNGAEAMNAAGDINIK